MSPFNWQGASTCGRPRNAREFTSAQHDALSPNACAAHLNALVKAGLFAEAA